MLERFNLNYGWQFLDYFEDDFCFSQNLKNSVTIDLPHTCKIIPYNNFNEESFLLISTYLKNVFINSNFKSNKIYLSFEGVMSKCEVYVNGNFAGKHSGGFTGFSIDVTSNVIFGSNNTIVLKVDSNEDKSIPPFGGVIDYLTYGGVYREVYMDVYGENHLQYVLISTQYDQLEINYILDHSSQDITITGEIIDNENTIVSNFSFSSSSNNNELKYVHNFPNSHLWSIDDPYLYKLKTQFFINNILVDEKIDVFGVRSVKVDSENIYINNEKIHLLGLNRHQSYPYVGYAMPKSQQYLDAEILKKQLNCNIVRSSHYPQSRHFYDRCDQLGLLVLIEIPGWQYIGDEEWQKNLLDSTREMLFQNFNHPSIIIWGTRVNESADNHQLYSQTNAVIKKYDQYRPTGGVRNFSNSEFLEDIYTYNDFTHSGSNQGLSKPNKIYKKKVPILITEHNGHMYPVKKNDNILIRINHSLRHAKVIDDSYKYPGIIGAIGWCMFDYNTHFQFGSGDRICYHGVLDMYRLPKGASYVYASQQNDAPYLEIVSNFAPGDIPKMIYDRIIVYTNVDYIELYKKGNYVGKFYKSSKFSNMKNPPIIIEDTIGEIMQKKEGFSPNDSNKIKKIMYKIVDGGIANLSLYDKLGMFLVMRKYNLSIKDGERLFNNYFSTLNLENEKYRFIGYSGDVKVIDKEYGVSNKFFFKTKIDHDLLVENDTYDVSKIDIYKVNEYDMVCDYASDVISFDVSGPIEIIGPKRVCLIGGSISIYIRTISKSGDAVVNIRDCDNNIISSIKVKVFKKGS